MRRGGAEIIPTGNELYDYIEASLEKNAVKTITFKNTPESKVELYTNKLSGNKLIKRYTRHLNDDVFKILKNKRSPNIVRIYEVCATEDEAIVVLEEYVEGETLEKHLSKGKLKRRTACKIAVDICDALSQLHAEGIVHRDIKPSNIIIKPDGTAVLIDFSIARLSNFHDKDTETLGTPGFAAPEQFGISQSVSSTDIFSLGVLMNLMLTGVHPSVGLTKGALGHIVRKCTAIEIKKRYRSAASLKRAIKFAAWI